MKPRITTSDIVRAAAVHQTTVSLALRNDQRLKPATIARIKAIAEKLGYAPDPMLSALASYRRAHRSEEGALVSCGKLSTSWSVFVRQRWCCAMMASVAVSEVSRRLPAGGAAAAAI